MVQLLSNFSKQGVRLGLFTQKVDIDDTDYSSKFFVISEFNPVFTAGRNPIAFNGSSLLKNGSEIQVECLDSAGNSLYIERAKSKSNQFTDISNFVISIHVYDETYNGPGKLILVGTTVKNEIVRWIGDITIDKTLTNSSKVRFYDSPTLNVRSLLYPVIDMDLVTEEFPPPVYSTPVAEASITGVVRSITISLSNHGSGYTGPSPNVSIDPPPSGVRATAIAIVVSGVVTDIIVTNEGSGYNLTSAPNVTIDPPPGPGLRAVAEAQMDGVISEIRVTNGGLGYNLGPPNITITGGGGSGADANAVMNPDGTVKEVIIVNEGYGYTSNPTITFSSPTRPLAPTLNVPVSFNKEFFGYAVTPHKDTNKLYVDKKRIDIDYRLSLSNIPDADADAVMIPTSSFNIQMEGKPINLHITRIQSPSSYDEKNVDITGSFIIKKVLDSKTVILDNPFYYQVGKDLFITNISNGTCAVDYNFIKYNTNPDSGLTLITAPNTQPINIKQSYAEITYRNLRTFSGFIARHKLYRKSLFRVGDFQLVSDEPLGAIELLTDTVTFNKAYDQMGRFYQQPHIEKYWFSSSDDLTLTAGAFPINSMKISSPSFADADGLKCVILKTDSLGIINDNVYYPYNETEFNNLSGQSYNSNFISLKKNSLYVLSADVIVNKDANDKTSNVSFYFTSSIVDIQKEKTYSSPHGLKLGEIAVKENIKTKYFSQRQYLYFTPIEDYFGTLVVVPYHCNVTLSNISLKVYGDYGFSPDVLFIRVPFSVNIKNEAFELKAELFDINHNIVYSDLKTTLTFDANGDSLYSVIPGYTDLMGSMGATVINNNRTIKAATNIFNIGGDVYVPDLKLSDDTPQRFVGWKTPTSGDPDNAGKLCYTNVSRLIIDNNDYISLSSVDSSGVETTARSLAIKYDGMRELGRKIFVDLAGTKFRSP